MSEARKLVAILVADVVGYSRLAGADEERTLARLRELRADLIEPSIAMHRGRIVKRTGDGSIIEFRSVVDALRCAIEVQNAMAGRNRDLPLERRMEFRVGIHLGDVVEESDGDLMGDGVNIAARLEGVAKPGGICLSEDAYRQVQGKVEANFADAGEQRLKNISRPVRAYYLASKTPAEPARLPFMRRLAAALGAGRTRRDSTAAVLRRNRALIAPLILVVVAGSLVLVRLWPALPLTGFEQGTPARMPTKNLEAYDNYLRAESVGFYNGGDAAPARAMAYYAKAVELDPGFVDAQSGYALAAALVSAFNLDFFGSLPVTRKRAYDAAGRALELDPSSSRAYLALASLQLTDGRHADAIASARRAVSVAPHDPAPLATLGVILAFSGASTQAVASAEQALRLSSSPPPGVRLLAGVVFYNARQYDRAIEEMKAVSAIWPDASAPHEYLAAAYGHLGKLDLAKREVERIPESVFPKQGLALARLVYGLLYGWVEDLNHHLEGLKAAGIPEWPFGFEGRQQDQVTGQALAALAVGHTWEGYVPVKVGESKPFILQIDNDYRIALRTPRTLSIGVARLENDRLCTQVDGYYSGLSLCGAVYRTVVGSPDGVDYVYVAPDDLFYFSMKD
jgi:class 3 adenylate cyclase/tetratricopeptide (TPR) repeat protein